MRRLALIVMCCGLLQLCVPAPAQAWYGWIDALSGPGEWHGFHVDLRLVCFGNVTPKSKRAGEGDERDARKTPGELQSDAFQGAFGLEATCPADERGYRRQSSIGLEFRLFEADPNRAYAQNQEIKLVTIEPSFSRDVFANPNYNFVAVGAAGGMYWFSSEGFRSFSGVILEPFRFDIHLPPFDFTDMPTGKRIALAIAQMVVFRAGVVMFPRGFEANAFAANTRDTARRLPSEWLFGRTIFVDARPLFRIKKPKLP